MCCYIYLVNIFFYTYLIFWESLIFSLISIFNFSAKIFCFLLSSAVLGAQTPEQSAQKLKRS